MVSCVYFAGTPATEAGRNARAAIAPCTLSTWVTASANVRAPSRPTARTSSRLMTRSVRFAHGCRGHGGDVGRVRRRRAYLAEPSAEAGGSAAQAGVDQGVHQPVPLDRPGPARRS